MASPLFSGMKLDHKFVLALVSAAPLSASAATVSTFPYSNSFSNAVEAAQFSPSVATNGGNPTSSWEWNEPQQALHNILFASNVVGPANGSASASTVTASGAGLVGQSFVMSTNFTINSFTGAPRIGFGAMGANAAFTSNTLLADINATGSIMRFAAIGTLPSTLTTTTGPGWVHGALVAGTQYTLTLTGVREGAGMTFTLSLAGGIDPVTQETRTGSISTSMASAPTGLNFGYRNSTASNSSMDITADNFSLAIVPEPSATAMLGSAILAFLTRRRRVI
jgi:hypothetical protein